MVGDTAGMSADLFESYAGSLIATIALAVAAKKSMTSDLVVLPIIVSSIGVLASVIGTFLVRTKEGASMNNFLWSFRIGIFGATILGVIGAGLYISAKDMDFNLLWVILFGNLLGIIVGTATEYFTSYEYKPVKWMASQARQELHQ
ncbi:MAG: hypothetical protein Ct9H90mP2_08710 [Dehalococcoidia bacterium]|nr:MAG: hypothetical protein Ct9H90mP2_08710 [Dehalococcoidia bacterium]